MKEIYETLTDFYHVVYFNGYTACLRSVRMNRTETGGKRGKREQ